MASQTALHPSNLDGEQKEEDESFVYAGQLANSLVLPMVLQTAIELGVFEILAKAGPGAKLSPSQISAEMSTINPEAPKMLDRILRMLTSHSVLSCSAGADDAGSFQRLYALSPVSKHFVPDQDGVSFRPMMALLQDKVFLASCLQTRLTAMDPITYKAAALGNLEALEQYDISHPLNGFSSSILVEEKYPATGGTDQALAAKFVKYVLDKCPSLLLKANAEDDTSLHVAARYGHASIVKVLIEHQKSQHQDLESGVVEATTEMIGQLNKKSDTTLHEAVRHNHIKVVKQLLLEVDPEFCATVAGETPLYLAAERHFSNLVSEILNKLKSPAYDDPLGRTALHAAAFWDDEAIAYFIFFAL